jgi:hypothetical protein
MRAPTPPGSPAITAATLAAILARLGVTRIYTAADRRIAVVSVGYDLTAWTDGRQLWCTRAPYSLPSLLFLSRLAPLAF